MKLLRFDDEGTARLGVVRGDDIVVLDGWASMLAIIAGADLGFVIVHHVRLEALRQRSNLVCEEAGDCWDHLEAGAAKLSHQHEHQNQKGEPGLPNAGPLPCLGIVRAPSEVLHILACQRQ